MNGDLQEIVMAGEKEEVRGAAKIMKGYAKRLVGELSGRPDLVVKGEEEQTKALRRIRQARKADGQSR